MNVRKRKGSTASPKPSQAKASTSAGIEKDGRANLRGGPNYESKRDYDRAERIYRDRK
jgi:hypothetical protein